MDGIASGNFNEKVFNGVPASLQETATGSVVKPDHVYQIHGERLWACIQRRTAELLVEVPVPGS